MNSPLKESESIYTKFPPWDWLLPINQPDITNVFLNRRIGFNRDLIDHDRSKFMQALFMSFSLDAAEKDRVLKEYKFLSQFQYDALLLTWEEEKETFKKEVEAKGLHNELNELLIKAKVEWALILEKDTTFLIYIDEILSKDDKLFETEYEASVLLSMAQKYSDEFLFNKIAKNIIDSKIVDNSDLLKKIVNDYFFNAIKEGYSNSNNYQEMVDLINSQKNLEEAHKAFVNTCVILYIVQKEGFNFLFEDQNRLLFIENCMDNQSDNPDICRMIAWAYILRSQTHNSMTLAFKWMERCVEASLLVDNENVSIRHVLGSRQNRNKILKNVFYFLAIGSIFSDYGNESETQNINKDIVERFYDMLAMLEIDSKTITRQKFYIENIIYILAIEHTIGRSPISASISDEVRSHDDKLVQILYNKKSLDITSRDFSRMFSEKYDEEDKFSLLLVFLFIMRGTNNSKLAESLSTKLSKLYQNEFQHLNVKNLILKINEKELLPSKPVKKQTKHLLKSLR